MNRQLLIKLPNVPLATATIYGFTETSEEWGDNKHHIFG